MRTKSEMYPIVERWLVSAITKEEFCRQEGLPLHVLSYWVSRYNRKRGETGSAQGFVPLEVTGIAKSPVSIFRSDTAHGKQGQLPPTPQ